MKTTTNESKSQNGQREDAIDLLETQHRQVEKSFAAIGKSGRPRASAVKEVADQLAIHMAIEERIFYPSVHDDVVKDETDELLREAVEEHLAAKRTIADLLQMTPSDEQYEAKVEVLKELIEHHVEEEEKELFPQIRKLKAKGELIELADAMRELTVELTARGGARDGVAAETDEAADLDAPMPRPGEARSRSNQRI